MDDLKDDSSDTIDENDFLNGVNSILDTNFISIDEVAEHLRAHPEKVKLLEPPPGWIDPVTGESGYEQ